MPQRCNPQTVAKAHLRAHSWRKAAKTLNDIYGVSLSHAAWRDYALGKHDIANPDTRARLMLPSRACPSCGYKHVTNKRPKQKRIREFGFLIEKAKSFLEVLELRQAPR